MMTSAVAASQTAAEGRLAAVTRALLKRPVKFEGASPVSATRFMCRRQDAMGQIPRLSRTRGWRSTNLAATTAPSVGVYIMTAEHFGVSRVVGLGNKIDIEESQALEYLGEDPETSAIVMYVSPAQALRLIIAFAYEKGEPVITEMTGQASVCCAIAKVVDRGQVVVDLPCIGDRAFGLAGENDVIVAFPPSRTDQLLEGLKETERSASYPFKPFMRWPVLFPPEMEPRRPEVE